MIRSRTIANRVSAGTFTLPSGLEVVLQPQIESLDRLEWEKIVPADNFFLQWDYLHAFEKLSPSNMSFHYGLLYDGKKTLAAFYFQVVHLTAEEISYILQPITSSSKIHDLGNGLREWLKKCREDNGFRILVSGNNFVSGEYGVCLVKDADPEKIFVALAETVKVITKNDRVPGKISAILVKDYFQETAQSGADFLRKKRYHRFLVEPEMIVPVSANWINFDDYVAALSKKYRNRTKAVLKKTEKLKIVELDGESLEKASAEIYRLYHNVFEKAKFRLSVLHPDYFREMKKQFPETFRIFGYSENGKWVAFRSAFHLENHLEAHFIGIDYQVNEKTPLYQRVLYDFIAEGIEAGYQKVFLGRTAAEMKSTVGAEPHDLVCYIRHRNGLSNQVIRPFIDYLKPSPWVPRSPFKEGE
ncbi:MAG: GNAT family N-acetyltransferase [Bacteroidota bacterium]|nr:GNAT family N-acetyltransferase [Bacteroidota bacterium]